MIEILPVDGILRFLAFCRLPRQLYRGKPGFAASLDAERWTLHAKKLNPHFKLVESQAWLARKDGQWVGRIQAQVYHEDYAPREASRGQFGSLDAIDDQAVVDALLETAENWVRQRGQQVMHGPFSPSINGELGLLIEGFQATPMVLMPWHPPYLQALVEARGYHKARDLISYRYAISDAEKIDRPSVAERPEWRDRLRIRAIDFKNLDAEVTTLVDIFNDAWAENWGFVPMTHAELMSSAEALKYVTPAEGSFIIELDGEPQAFGVILLNLFELTEGFDGRLLPFNFARLAWRLRKHVYKTGRLALLGVRRGLHRKTAGGAVLFAFIEEARRRSRKHALEQIEFGWVLEDNMAIRRPIEWAGSKIDKVHRVYEKAL
ncbi:hypothetical protein [Beijerinckia indica]|uniref:N-acetyltransferase domain-containing protein n=1 Tax=Beijerinckia indica subsp. indica (strain ATCC 9039 / DSM 1715 / NCIMB 8712) TaxID=395963 RepID=B2IBE7_BEII9|nr:hypothetical protein [Beijerinckia indica]ACB96573.1 conserved hypothetical protein [Beijerinckia indica subsp. indica ATCC 9039]